MLLHTSVASRKIGSPFVPRLILTRNDRTISIGHVSDESQVVTGPLEEFKRSRA